MIPPAETADVFRMACQGLESALLILIQVRVVLAKSVIRSRQLEFQRILPAIDERGRPNPFPRRL